MKNNGWFFRGRWLAILFVSQLAMTWAEELIKPASITGSQPAAGGGSTSATARVVLNEWPKRDRVEIPWTGGDVAAMTLSTSPFQYVAGWEVRPKDQILRVYLKHSTQPVAPGILGIEPMAATGVQVDDRVVLRVGDGRRIELKDSNFSCEWRVKPTQSCLYAVEVTGRSGLEEGETVEVLVDDQIVMGLLEDTGNFRKWVNTPIGELELKGGKEQVIQLRIGEGRWGFRADVLAVTLRPMPEETMSASARQAAKWWRGARKSGKAEGNPPAGKSKPTLP